MEKLEIESKRPFEITRGSLVNTVQFSPELLEWELKMAQIAEYNLIQRGKHES